MNSNSVNDAELDAFLKGDDALASGLQAMGQPSPSAELDAAILAQAEAMMAQEQAPATRPSAANDAGAPPAPRHAQAGLRWCAPVGIAAALIAGVLAQQSWQSETDIERLARQPAASLASMPAPVVEMTPAPVVSDRVAPTAAKQSSRPQGPREAVRAPAQVATPAPPPPREAEPAPMLDAAAPPREAIAAPAPAPSLRYSAPAFAPAPAPAPDAAGAPPEAASQVPVMARRSRIAVAPAPAAPSTLARPAAGAPDPVAWLAAIDAMLRAGLRRDTLEEWDRFRAAYPDYPVPAATVDQITALRR